MENEINDAINQITVEFNSEVENSIKALLGIAKCPACDDRKKMQVKLIENGYDIVDCKFKSNALKEFIYLTDLRNAFKVGFRVVIG
jgi:glutaredoxin-related protein